MIFYAIYIVKDIYNAISHNSILHIMKNFLHVINDFRSEPEFSDCKKLPLSRKLNLMHLVQFYLFNSDIFSGKITFTIIYSAYFFQCYFSSCFLKEMQPEF